MKPSDIIDIVNPGFGLVWVLPFVGILLSLALIPSVLPNIWHKHYGKFVLLWVALVLGPLAFVQGVSETFHTVSDTYLHHFLPFILMICTLYVLTGHMRLDINLPASPKYNTLVLAFASLCANILGTTGASMLFIRPFLAMNSKRKYITHSVIFFIFLVGNVGGGLSPLGDPPLFIGFLNGVSFFWPTFHLFWPFGFLWLNLLFFYYGLDSLLYRSRKVSIHLTERTSLPAVRLQGREQIPLFLLVIGATFISGVWHPGIMIPVLGVPLALENIIRDGVFLFVLTLSFRFGHVEHRLRNAFSWEPLLELGILFAGIFITAVPVLAILQAGETGALGNFVKALSHHGQPINSLYFWSSGLMSAFLDNAPTYLAFFHLASGNPEILMGEASGTLQAISCGSVFMGALTYIGNAPNFMIKMIAQERDIPMPHFLGYIGWSIVILCPLFLALSFFFFP